MMVAYIFVCKATTLINLVLILSEYYNVFSNRGNECTNELLSGLFGTQLTGRTVNAISSLHPLKALEILVIPRSSALKKQYELGSVKRHMEFPALSVNVHSIPAIKES
jgi:hypothetical protein